MYIISNWSLEDQYKEVQKDNPESWKAFLRRIHEVTIYKEAGTLITIYDSVEAYLKRKEKFHTIEPDERMSIRQSRKHFFQKEEQNTMNKDKKTDEEEIILPPYTGLRRVYTYQPYTVHRVKRMLKDDRLCSREYQSRIQSEPKELRYT